MPRAYPCPTADLPLTPCTPAQSLVVRAASVAVAMTAISPCSNHSSGQYLDRIAVEHEVFAPDALTFEARRRAPNTRRAEARAKLMMDRIGYVGDGRARSKREGFRGHLSVH